MDNDEVNFGEKLPSQSEFVEEAIPLVIYNEEIKSKSNYYIYLV